jgi:Flp pilus assembly protein CpaB
MFPRIRQQLDGPPLAWPPVLDRVAEAWWSAGPRSRAAAVAALTVLVVLAGIAHAAAGGDGPPTTVYVAAHELQPGDTLRAGDVRRRDWPQDLVPDGALERPTGTLRALVQAGAVITAGHLGDDAIAAALSSSQVAVPVPVELAPALVPGSAVDLIGPGPDGRGERLASDARVIGHDAEVVWLGVGADAAVAVSAAVGNGTLAVALRPASSGGAASGG